MAKGLKEGERVKGEAKRVLGEAKAKRRFPDDWENKILKGVVVSRCASGRSVTVQWSTMATPLRVSTRMLERQETNAAAATTSAAAASTNEADTASAPTVTGRRRGRPRRTEPVPVIPGGITDDEMEEIPECDGIDSDDEVVEDDETEEEEDDDANIPAHGSVWHRVPEITRDEEGRAKMGCRLLWRDGLGNDRSPMQYFMHLYPHTHLTETIRATNNNFEDAGINSKLTRQEYFVFVGLVFACSLYPKFSVADMFSKSSGLRRTAFLLVPDFTKYMTGYRFKNIMKHLVFSYGVSDEEAASCSFWQVQPLVDAFNDCRVQRVIPGYKLVVDESMSEWRGKDQRYGAKSGCPHVTKIIRKPKGVGMEIKNLACCDSGIMMALEIMAGKEEMRTRTFVREYGSGTALLLRLSQAWKGSGRLVVADSAFASVKSAIALKCTNGLYFHGLVKTAHRKFPKKWLNEVPIDVRGGHVVLETTEDGVNLRAITWNDGKKDKTTGAIVRKNIIASCGTTLLGIHRPP